MTYSLTFERDIFQLKIGRPYARALFDHTVLWLYTIFNARSNVISNNKRNELVGRATTGRCPFIFRNSWFDSLEHIIMRILQFQYVLNIKYPAYVLPKNLWTSYVWTFRVKKSYRFGLIYLTWHELLQIREPFRFDPRMTGDRPSPFRNYKIATRVFAWNWFFDAFRWRAMTA